MIAVVYLRKQAFRGGLYLTGSKLASQGLSFIRNIIVARCIGVENYGIASTFAITLSILDVLSSLSVDKLLIQAPDGNDEDLENAAHAVQALKGATGAALVLALASPLSHLFSAPNTAWAFRFLAITIMLRGICHLDAQRVQRDLNYGPAVMVDVAQQLIPTLLAWPLALWLHDYSAVLYLLIIQTIVASVASFAVAHRPYHWKWRGNAVRRFWGFGWPLVVNGILLFGIYQGDRFLIASSERLFGSHAYSLASLGIYSAAVTLTLAPMTALGSICSSLLLPLLARHQADRPVLTERYASALNLLTLTGAAYALALALCGRWVMVRLFGPPYAGATMLVTWLAIAQAFRIARFAPTVAAMACGDTKNAMVANCARFSFLGVAAVVVISNAPLLWIAIAASAGEFLGLIVSFILLRIHQAVPVFIGLKATVALLTATSCGAYLSIRSVVFGELLRPFPLLAIAIFIGCLVYLLRSARTSNLITYSLPPAM